LPIVSGARRHLLAGELDAVSTQRAISAPA